ncbi:MAG: antibiotic biosynthesis monooxygenase [Ilumatobacteraceae bacterium]|nr:antibiotic biosynthesis monooxygenase [Ilumatobacteraceae bacterium]
MIVVTGSLVAKPEALEEALAMSLEHVHRSRLEPGCLLHSVHRDVEDPNRLMFLEHWADRDALLAHFAVPASRVFGKAAEQLASERSTMVVYDAEPITEQLIPRRRERP